MVGIAIGGTVPLANLADLPQARADRWNSRARIFNWTTRRSSRERTTTLFANHIYRVVSPELKKL